VPFEVKLIIHQGTEIVFSDTPTGTIIVEPISNTPVTGVVTFTTWDGEFNPNRIELYYLKGWKPLTEFFGTIIFDEIAEQIILADYLNPGNAAFGGSVNMQ